jgi:2Fe-2S ferredoxin
MTKIVFIEHNGTEHTVEAQAGRSVMQTAIDNMVPGIVGVCGGCCSCSTCHAYVDPAWISRLPEKSQEEIDTLDGALDVQDNSRLACQINVSPDMDGLVIRLPENQC